MPDARLYYPKGILPNASECCMPDLNYLLNKLTTGTWTYVNITTPRNLLLDNNGYLVTVEMNPSKLDRFNAENLTLISRTPIAGSVGYLMALGFSNNAYFAGLISGPIVVIDSRNLTILYNITSTHINNLRGIILLNNGSTMVTTDTNNNTLDFFYRTSNTSFNYQFAYQKSVNYSGPHGLTVYNDTLFYATSYGTNSIYSYNADRNSSLWIEKLVVNTNLNTSNSGGTFMTVDECGRYWFALEMSFVNIYDNSDNWIGNLSLGNGLILDVLIAENYVMYFSDRNATQSRIIRIDPHIQC